MQVPAKWNIIEYLINYQTVLLVENVYYILRFRYITWNVSNFPLMRNNFNDKGGKLTLKSLRAIYSFNSNKSTIIFRLKTLFWIKCIHVSCFQV